MKKLLFFAFAILGSSMGAMEITIHTSCGTVVTKEISDNATSGQITQASVATNVSECGVRPDKVTISIQP